MLVIGSCAPTIGIDGAVIAFVFTTAVAGVLDELEVVPEDVDVVAAELTFEVVVVEPLDVTKGVELVLGTVVELPSAEPLEPPPAKPLDPPLPPPPEQFVRTNNMMGKSIK